MYVWMKVSKDEYELPLAVADSLAELAKMLNVSRYTIASSYCRYARGEKWSCYRKIEIEDEKENMA